MTVFWKLENNWSVLSGGKSKETNLSLGWERREATQLSWPNPQSKRLMIRVTTEYGLEVELKTEEFTGSLLETVMSLDPCTRQLPFSHLGRRLKIYSLEKIKQRVFLVDSRHRVGQGSVLKTRILSQSLHTECWNPTAFLFPSSEQWQPGVYSPGKSGKCFSGAFD